MEGNINHVNNAKKVYFSTEYHQALTDRIDFMVDLWYNGLERVKKEYVRQNPDDDVSTNKRLLEKVNKKVIWNEALNELVDIYNKSEAYPYIQELLARM